MKKALIASTALVLTAGVAAADVTISGYGRTGLNYYDGPQADRVTSDEFGNSWTQEANKTTIQSRLRLNIDASTSTDTGIDFGGRIRLQWDQGDEETTVAPGYLYMSTSGLRMEVGNSNTAFDSAGLLYASEVGIFDRSFGNSRGNFFAYNTDGYPSASNFDGDDLLNDYLGIFASYSIDNLTLRGSIVNPDQRYSPSFNFSKKEVGISVDYTWNDRLELSAAYVSNGAGLDGNDQWFVGARYAVMDNARIGLNYIDNGEPGEYVYDAGTNTYSWDQDDLDKTVVLYGDYTMNEWNFEAYIANNGDDANERDNAFGLGVNYDLGGARVSGGIQSDYNKDTLADFGVRFDF